MKIQKKDYFAPIYLNEMDQVKLMNRTDTKYWFHEGLLPRLLEEVAQNYFMLNMNDEIALPYSTVYYDTAENRMFTAHHNGKLNRFKIRRRSYMSSGISFLEVKFKSNKGRTIKKRIPTGFNTTNFTENEQQFLNELTPFSEAVLHPALINNFMRITLVNKNFKERCTIDTSLRFETENKIVSLNNLVSIHQTLKHPNTCIENMVPITFFTF